jgi:AraC-like DNA-binding protein
MTRHANSLTDRDRTSSTASAVATQPASEIRLLVDALTRLGYAGEALATRAGVAGVDVRDPDARVPCAAYGAIVALAQAERFTPNLALAVARAVPIGAYPLVDYLVLTSDSVGAGVRQLARYFRILDNPMTIRVREEADPIQVVFDAGRSTTFAVEYAVSLMVLHFMREADGRFAVSHVSFEHELDEAEAYERAFGCRVHPRADVNAVDVPLDVWRLPLRRRDPVLRRVLEQHADQALARLPSGRGLVLDVQRALAPRVAGGDTRVGAIARELGVSARTLQRRLADEGASYQQLFDTARRDAAGQYLADSTLAIGEVAYLVGYSEPAAFYRAFRRWYGETPEAFRRNNRRS